MSLSFPVSLPVIVVHSSKSFSFLGCSLIRIVSPTTPGSVSLVHGFIHDKSVPFLVFDTSSKIVYDCHFDADQTHNRVTTDWKVL